MGRKEPCKSTTDAGVRDVNGFFRGRGRGSRSSRRARYAIKTPYLRSSTPSLASEILQTSKLFASPLSVGEKLSQAIPILNPPQYLGWQLYFPTTTFVESSVLISQIKAFEDHILKHPGVYVVQQILKQRWFYIPLDFVINDYRFVSSWVNFIQQLQDTPYLVLSCLGMAMHRIVSTMVVEMVTRLGHNRSTDQNYSRRICVRKLHARPINFVTLLGIVELAADSYDRLFAVHGRVDYVAPVERECTWIAYKCKRCGHEQAIRQGDSFPNKPMKCRIQCKCKIDFNELRSSPYTQIVCKQMIQLSELDRSRQFTIELLDDLVDVVCPGNEITVAGVLKIKSADKEHNHELLKRPDQSLYMQAISVVRITNSNNIHNSNSTQEDLEVIQMITREPNCIRLLVQSLATEMCGNEMVKVAVLLSLFGGSGSQLHNEGELNILVIGNPGLGKSKLLQNAASISKIGTLVSGKSPIQQTNLSTSLNTSNSIDAGSLLVSHAGHCCIDDMDKLGSNQETLTRTMQTKLVTERSTTLTFSVAAKSSVLVAVNPVEGHYDSSKQLRENVHLRPSFLSLFHLVLVLFDKADKDRDNILTEHIKFLHSGIKKTLSIPPKDSMKLTRNDDLRKNEEVSLFERLKLNCDELLDLLPTVLLKKYIAYSRRNIKPLLSKEAVLLIKDFYLELRIEKNYEERFSITTRQLDALIRLTQARARIDLCLQATTLHTRDVIELLQYCHTDATVIDTTLNGSICGTSHGSQVRKFIQILQLRSNALGRNIFEFEELKDMASSAGIKCGITNLVDLVNIQGYLLKKGPNLYEVRF